MANLVHTAQGTFRKASRRILAAVSFAVITAAGLLAYFISPSILYGVIGAYGWADPWQTLSWFLLALPAALVFGIMGKFQARVLRLGTWLEKDEENAEESGAAQPTGPRTWTVRTQLGGVAASLVYVYAMTLVAKLYYGGPLPNGGPFIPAGDRTEVGLTLAGWALSGLVFGLVQGDPKETQVERKRVRGRLAWALASAVAWTAASLACFVFFKSWVIGYEPICFSCLYRYIDSALTVGAVIGIAGGLALLYRPLSVAFALAVCLLAIGKAATVAQPLFAERVVHPYYILVADMPYPYPYIERVAFSHDGEVLAVKTTSKEVGEDTGVKILLYRTSSWTPLGEITDGSGSFDPFLEFDTNITIGAPRPAHEVVRIKSRGNGRLLHMVDFDAAPVPGRMPGGYSYTPPSAWAKGQLLAPDGRTIVLDPEPIWSCCSPNDVASAVSPDGQYIVAGYEIGGLWVWRVP
jgi:MFS family permease